MLVVGCWVLGAGCWRLGVGCWVFSVGSCGLAGEGWVVRLPLIHISEPTRLLSISYAVFCLKKKKITNSTIQRIMTSVRTKA